MRGGYFFGGIGIIIYYTVNISIISFLSPDEDMAMEEADDEVEGFEGIQMGERKPQFYNTGSQFQNDDLWGSES